MIEITGHSAIDSATAEIAVYLRDATPGLRDQHYYDVAMQLRDRIMTGTRDLDRQNADVSEQHYHQGDGMPGHRNAPACTCQTPNTETRPHAA